MTRNFQRDRFTWLIYLIMAFYAYFLNVLGPVTPFLKSDLHLSYTISSLHFSAFAVGILIIGFGGHVLIQRIGRWASLWSGVIGMSLSALLLAVGQTPVVTIAASFLMGLVGSLILALVPAILSDQHGELRAVAVSEANMLGSLVVTAAPLLVGWCAQYLGNWRLALVSVAFTPIILYFGLGKGTSRASAALQEGPVQAKLPLPLQFWIYWLALMLAVSVEFCMIFWSADFLENVLGLPKAEAAQAVSLFLGT